MEIAKLKLKAKELSDLACKSCTKNWLENHDGSSDPIDDINLCFKAGFISKKLKERLIEEVLELT